MHLYHTLEKALKRENNFITDEGTLKKWVVISKAQQHDERLLTLLIEEPELKAHFFKEISGHQIFNLPLFLQFVEQKEYLADSYTAYKNKVGLTVDGRYLKSQSEVSLAWPYKDCVLEGGQSTEEKGRNEIFFNTVLAQDEITQLLEPKVLTAAKRYDATGSKPIESFTRNEAGYITDNLIIKGNNLLALHSLKKEFAGRVKLIYIDPPYNTGNDGFRYNDSFNHSSWLTFMKNRLEVARGLLSKEGCIMVQVDHHELGYINVLLDEVFGKENKVQIIAVKTASPAGFKTVNPGPIDVTEYILFYTKEKKAFPFRKSYVPVGYNQNYNLFLEKDSDLSKWQFIPIKQKVLQELGFKEEADAKKVYGELWKKMQGLLVEDFAYRNAENIVSIRDPHKPTEEVKRLMQQSANEERVIPYKRDDGSTMYLYKGGALAFYSNKMKEIDGKVEVTELLTDFWNHISWAGIAKEGGVKLKNGKKPEKLIKQVLEIATSAGDIVLDYHLGSGTTCSVAHKMGRQYIGLEQLDYGENDSLKRMESVVNGEQSGVSKAVNWKGGGSFIYCELKKYNEAFVEAIRDAEDTAALLLIWEDMKARSFLHYNLDLKAQDATMAEFKTFSLKQQKEHLVSLLNMNQLYVPLSAMKDEAYGVTEEEARITTDFYQLKN